MKITSADPTVAALLCSPGVIRFESRYVSNAMTFVDHVQQAREPDVDKLAQAASRHVTMICK